MIMIYNHVFAVHKLGGYCCLFKRASHNTQLTQLHSLPSLPSFIIQKIKTHIFFSLCSKQRACTRHIIPNNFINKNIRINFFRKVYPPFLCHYFNQKKKKKWSFKTKYGDSMLYNLPFNSIKTVWSFAKIAGSLSIN
ncbi:hypothetical protein M2132_000500 [Dysgonomonas sp. PH5-45]|nr:hypothetical protein [Dysgonomonas sp. PH5-45]MDH6386971.1 hypothetical protein [Dysgonomonas sp. PH5-37]